MAGIYIWNAILAAVLTFMASGFVYSIVEGIASALTKEEWFSIVFGILCFIFWIFITAWFNKPDSNGNISTSVPDCFVATAVYQNKTHPDVLTLKKFRDQVLGKNVFGKIAVFCYYKIGPYLAKLAVAHPVIRDFAYRRLSKLVKWVRANYKEL